MPLGIKSSSAEPHGAVPAPADQLLCVLHDEFTHSTPFYVLGLWRLLQTAGVCRLKYLYASSTDFPKTAVNTN